MTMSFSVPKKSSMNFWERFTWFLIFGFPLFPKEGDTGCIDDMGYDWVWRDGCWRSQPKELGI